jgi:hypothetical protein
MQANIRVGNKRRKERPVKAFEKEPNRYGDGDGDGTTVIDQE